MPIVLPSVTADQSGGLPDLSLPGSGAARIGGVESYYIYNNLTMNDRNTVDTYIVKEIGGLDDADVRDSREVIPQDHGEHVFDSWYGGRTITLAGTIVSYNVHKLRDMQEALRYSFSNLEDLPLRIMSPYKTVVHHEHPDELEAPGVEIQCRKSQPIQMREAQQGATFTRDFLITLRAYDPIFRSTYIISLSQTGATSPKQFTLTNIGNYLSHPIIQLSGPMSNPLIQNSTTGTTTSITGTIPAGTTWTLDSQAKTFVDNTGANKFSTLSVDSDWQTIAVGENDMFVSFSTATVDTAVAVNFRHAWI